MISTNETQGNVQIAYILYASLYYDMSSSCIGQKSRCVCGKLWEREETGHSRKEELPGNYGRLSGGRVPSQKKNSRL